MKTTIGVYDTHDKAASAVQKLVDAGFPSSQISVIGKAGEEHEKVELTDGTPMKMAAAEVGVGAAGGAVIGVLTGVGLFAIPGLGFLYGAGALVGAIAGLDFGLIGAGIVSALTLPGLKEEHAADYERHIKEGHFLLVVQGDKGDLDKAKAILEGHGAHTHLGRHED